MNEDSSDARNALLSFETSVAHQNPKLGLRCSPLRNDSQMISSFYILSLFSVLWISEHVKEKDNGTQKIWKSDPLFYAFD